MFERVPELDVVYVPWEAATPDEAVRIGATWLMSQPGQRLVLLHTKGMYDNNALLPALTRGAVVEKPNTVRGHWAGGPVLAPWPSEKVLATISDDIAQRATAVCILEWGEQSFVRAWLDAHAAVSLVAGHIPPAVKELISPVVEAAMRDLSQTVNHNNALLQSYEKSYAVRTLQELRRAGHSYDVDNLCAWSLANGFTQSEVKHLREYAEQVLSGRSFRLRDTVGPNRGYAKYWEQAAESHS